MALAQKSLRGEQAGISDLVDDLMGVFLGIRSERLGANFIYFLRTEG